jgi:hypothetical protein
MCKSREADLILREILQLRALNGTMFNRPLIHIKVLFLGVFLVFFLPKEGHLTQVGIQYVSLEDVIQRSDAVVEVAKADSFITQEEIKIHRNVKKYPPYIKSLYHYRVTGNLYKEDTSLSIGKVIAVEDANFESDLRLHKLYYLEGIGKSPIHDRYRPGVDVYDVKKEKLILFLRKTEKNGLFKYTVDFAYEGYSHKRGIVRMIGELKK